MRKIFPFLLLSLFFLSCATTHKEKWGYRNGKLITEGWVDGDTFRNPSIGVPRPMTKDLETRKKEAKKAAIIMANRNLLDKFMEIRFFEYHASDIHEQREKFKKEFMKYLKDGIILSKVISASFDKEQFCEIGYQLRQKGLKDWVRYGIWPEDEKFKK